MKKIVLSILLLAFAGISFAQNSIFIPREVRNSVKKGVRTLEGIPGPNYWQNHSEYKINAKVDIEKSVLSGDEKITYFNESPDTLKTLVMRIYQDFQKAGATRDFYMGNKDFLPPVDIKYIKINGKDYDISDTSKSVRRGSTNMFVRLKSAMLPKTKVEIEVGWSFIIPRKRMNRMGNFGNGDMFIAYWYPQMAVYDDISGWDKIDYQGIVEFYNDFSDYDVNITLPKNTVMWATGVLQNGSEVLNPAIYKKYEEAKKSEKVVRIITEDDRNNGSVTADKDELTWNFKANHVPDFSFAISDSYLWDGRKVVTDSSSAGVKSTFVQAAYNPGTPNFEDAAEMGAISIDYMSHDLPGYPFPYPEMTSVANPGGGGGMETPMMANDGSPKNYASFAGLVFHEISHNYFPFFMGTNERTYAWMDEGWATFFTREVEERFQKENEKKYWERIVSSYEHGSGYMLDVPLVVPSFSVKGGFPRVTFYRRPGCAYMALMKMMGKENFKNALLNYIEAWNGKHPIPTDFFTSFNKSANEDLAWFWNPWFYEFGVPDLAIENVSQKDEAAEISIRKIGNIPTRVFVKVTFDDGSTKEFTRSIKAWKNNSLITLNFETEKNIQSVELGNSLIPDIDKTNNVWRRK
jgi:hypothetical protein